jgi:hypothetical protein
MNEPHELETKTTPAGLTTEQLANAGKAATAAEPRSFEDDTPEAAEPGRADQAVFSDDEAADLRRAWSEIQAGFVDEPRSAVEEADHLVASAMKRLAEMFAEERSGLEAQWDRGGDVSTEDLRLALQRYRSFFTRLLSA